MENRWSDAEAERFVARYGSGANRNEDIALRVYSSRLIGADPRLVLHGGGNTSVKTRLPDLFGEAVDVLCVKGSGWDLDSIEPPGLPAVRLEPLRRLRGLEALSDEEMVNAQRCNLLDSSAPNPSVETLLHAFLPHAFIDHTHSDAVLALTDQPNGAEICAEVFGDRAALVPYIMPGFALAKKAAEVLEDNPDVEGLILLKHGIFSFGATARDSYDRMISLVSLAETRLAEGRRAVFAPAALPDRMASVADVAPVLRGLTSAVVDPAEGIDRPSVLDFRSGDAVRTYVDGAEVARYGRAGVVTPDHAIRIKPWPMIVPAPAAGGLAAFRDGAAAALAEFQADYAAYFARHNGRDGVEKTALDPMPRVILVPGLGLFGLGKSAKDARIAADLAETTVRTVTDAEAIGRFESIAEGELFDIEYWSLEQAKLGKGAEKPLARRIVAVTGGAGAIGAATARAFAAEGAEIAVLDRDGEAAASVAAEVGGVGIACDVTDPAAVQAAFDAVAARFGGLDILVSNAGAAWQGTIGEVDDAVLRASFELNFFAHQTVAKAALAILRAQGKGGCLLFNASKQAVNPGPDFGPYGLPKAAALFLMRQYAVDHGGEGIRANAVNADRIRSGLLTDEMVADRARARGVSEDAYLSGNLLGREVTAADVAQAFLALALARKTTGAVLTVDGGNIAAAPR